MGSRRIDRDKLRAAIRKLSHEYVFYMLDDALDLLPQPKLLRLVKRYLDVGVPGWLEPDGVDARSLLSRVKAFERASLAGEYHESLNVNSQNYKDLSSGTAGWIAECRRLLDRCVAQEKQGEPTLIRRAGQ